MARVTVEDCVQRVPNRFNLVLLAANRARAIAAGRDADDRSGQRQESGRGPARDSPRTWSIAKELRETLIGTLQRVDEHSEAEEEAETLALLSDHSPTRK